MSDALASGHDDLPFNRYPYQGKGDFLNLMDYERSLPNRSSIFLITNINKQQFERQFLNTHDRTFSWMWKEYIYSSRLHFVKMPLRPHEIAGRSFALLIILTAEQQMGSALGIVNYGTSDFMLNESIKCANESLIPEILERRLEYPPVVIEISESQAKLDYDANSWLIGSDGAVKAVITVHIKGDQKIMIQRWCLESDVPVVKQETTMTKLFRKTTRSSSTTVQVANAPFTIPFEQLYLREPTPHTNEGDIQITDSQLRKLANNIR
jgi:hypothetical protein